MNCFLLHHISKKKESIEKIFLSEGWTYEVKNILTMNRADRLDT